MNTADPRYPIGRYRRPETASKKDIDTWIEAIETFPARLEKALGGMSQVQLDTPYREGGWTVGQVVHHCADSHMNSFMRFKLALTEEMPTIKPYLEAKWAELPDANELPIQSSLMLIKGLHHRWVVLLKSLSTDDLSKTFIHPENGREMRLDHTIALYAWHCNHHLAHIGLVG
ncbi:MAG: putative metal-dependent hydrolase [Vicingaceae bacterium]